MDRVALPVSGEFLVTSLQVGVIRHLAAVVLGTCSPSPLVRHQFAGRTASNVLVFRTHYTRNRPGRQPP